MSYPRQGTTVDRLMKETLSSFDSHIDDASHSLDRFWEETKRHLKSNIMMEYHKSFGGADWTLAQAKSRGTLLRIDRITKILLQNFYALIENDFKARKQKIYKEAVKRYAWVADQTTPDALTIKIPYRLNMREAAVDVYAGEGAASNWTERMGLWLGSYHSSLQDNIALGALNGSSVMDAATEVDQTKAGTPAYFIDDALTKIVQVEMWMEAMSAEDDFYGANYENLGLIEVWKTRYGIDVCDDCDANEGLNPEEADGDIPLHPNCRCFWRVVPASFKELLMQGDEDSRKLAYEMDARGLVPDSLVVRDASGNIAAKTIISFDTWERTATSSNEWDKFTSRSVGTRP